MTHLEKIQYEATLKVLSDMEVWKEFQEVCIPDDWDGRFTTAGAFRRDRCAEEMTLRLHFQEIFEAEHGDQP